MTEEQTEVKPKRQSALQVSQEILVKVDKILALLESEQSQPESPAMAAVPPAAAQPAVSPQVPATNPAPAAPEMTFTATPPTVPQAPPLEVPLDAALPGLPPQPAQDPQQARREGIARALLDPAQAPAVKEVLSYNKITDIRTVPADGLDRLFEVINTHLTTKNAPPIQA